MTDTHPAPLRIHVPANYPSNTSPVNTSRREIIPTDYHDLSPIDALAAQGRLLNKRLTQHGKTRSTDSLISNGSSALDDSFFPKFGGGEIFEGVLKGYDRRERLPERRERRTEEDQSVLESLPISALTISSSRPSTAQDHSRTESQSSSTSASTSSADSSSNEDYLPTAIHPPPRSNPPRLRPIIKTQLLTRPHSPDHSPTTPTDQFH